MAFDPHANGIFTHVAVAPSPAASGTALTVTSGYGATLAAVLALAGTTGQVNLTCFPDGSTPWLGNAPEILRLTGVAGDVITVARQQEGTPARTIVVGDMLSLSITAKTLSDIEVSVAALQASVPATLNVLLGSIDVPRRSFDRMRGAPNYVEASLAGSITSTATTITTTNINLCLVGEYPVIQIGAEQMLVIRGQNTATLIVVRHVNGTTAAAHTAGDAIIRDKVVSWVAIGDSSCQGTATGVTGEWDDHVSRTRRIVNNRFGGSLGHGFYGLWRGNHSTSAPLEYEFTGTWFLAGTSNPYFVGPWVNKYATTASDIITWNRPAKVSVGQIDVWYVVWSSGTAGTGANWSYSVDGGAYINNPLVTAGTTDPHPTNTTTLSATDATRRLDWWDGTKTMTLASVTGIENNGGFLFVDVGSAGTFKCRALFTYDGVSGSTLTNVKYVGPAAYNAFTTVSGDTVQKRPEIRKASIAVNDPTTFKIRSANAAGTNQLTMFAGIDVWNAVPTFGVTEGVKLHNLGYSANSLAAFVGARTVNDLGTTSGSPSITSAGRAAFASTDVGSQVINANVPAGAIITAVADATHATMNANATATVVAGAVANPTTIQGLGGSWDMAFNGCAASLLPAFVYHACWFNDSTVSAVFNGGDTAMTATFVSGNPAVTINAGNGIEPLDVGQLFMDGLAGVCASGTTIASRTDATHITISPAPSGSVGPTAVFLSAASATIAQGIKDRLGVFHSGGIGGTGLGVSPYADELVVVGYEQGTTHLLGQGSTATYQAVYRQGMHDWATANRVATLDIYKAWAAEGNVGFAAANADGLMDASDSSGFHEGPVGYRDMASRITRLLEFA